MPNRTNAVRKAQRWRYYCDFCKKAGGSAGHMTRHERGCTANPNRVCGVCAQAEAAPEPLAKLVEFVRSKMVWDKHVPEDCEPYAHLDKEMTEELRRLADGCPVCMLAALRQSKAYPPSGAFDMKAELKSLWNEINSQKQAQSHDYY